MADKKAALVTGGAKRVGRAMVLALAADGYDVAFTYYSSQKEAEALAAEIRSTNSVNALAIAADFTHSTNATCAVADAVLSHFGRLNVLVNNASLYQPRELRDTDEEQMRRLMAIHFESPLLLCQRFEAALRKSRGRIVNMVDLLAERPWPKYLAYCASKAALWNLTLGMARELAPDVTVNGIAPGVVDWPDDYPQAEKEKYLRRVPLARAGEPADVVAALRYLIAENSYMTGQVLRLDGGRSTT